MPTEFSALKEALGLVLTICGIVGAFATAAGFLAGKWRHERKLITSLITRLDRVTEYITCTEDQNEQRDILARANLKMTFALASELVKQGANGDLKRAVTEFSDLVVSLSTPPKPPIDLDPSI